MAINRRPARPADEAAPEERSRPSRPEETDEDTDALPVPSFRGGWSAGKQQAEATSDYAQAFKPEQSTQIIKFLEDAPYVNYRRHWVERNGQNGRVKRPYVCPQTVGKPCPLCNIGEKPQAVSSFNVALIGDDGVPILKTWDVGIKLFNVLAGYHEDPKVGPLTRGYFGVTQTAAKGKNGTAQTNVNPIKPSSLEDYDTVAPSDAELEAIGRYAADVVKLPKRGELEEIAAEFASDYDE